MLVYGDRSRVVDTRERLEAIVGGLHAPASGVMTVHDHHTRALIQAGELVQGLADAAFEQSGCDSHTPIEAAALELAVAIAKGSWGGSILAISQAAEALAALPLSETITCKMAEGFAFYAVYPEYYMAAAAAWNWSSTPFVIGVRSIGAGLAAAVAASTGAKSLITVRPVGHPFRRELRLSEPLRARLAAHAGPFAIVDEGPGLSGSSMGCVADLLEDLGVSQKRLVFFPSHRGELGEEASPRHRERWTGASRPVRTLDDSLAVKPIREWFSDLTGLVAKVEDISGGQWRTDVAEQTPAWSSRERRKFRLSTATGDYLVRFAGLGEEGEAKFERARLLSAADFTVEPVALRGGMLLERWVNGGPLEAFGPERPRFLRHLGEYLAFRARSFPASREDGADWASLTEMTIVNARELCGDPAACRLEAGLAKLGDVRATRPVHVDARLHAWEWLRLADGAFLKTDALDHSRAHDLVGCQDIVWDVAGAAVEFDLTLEEEAVLSRAVAPWSGVRDERHLAMYKLFYAAFQGGCWSMAAAGASGSEALCQNTQMSRHTRVLDRASASISF